MRRVNVTRDFEDAIIRKPDDVEGYSVYGDSLCEQGNVLGQLVALQIAMHRTTEPSRFMTLRRDEERVRTNIEALLPIPADLRPQLKLRWRWGFVHRLELSTTFNADYDARSALEPLFRHPATRFLRHFAVFANDRCPWLVPLLRDVQLPLLRGLDLSEDLGLQQLRDVLPDLESLSVGGGVLSAGALCWPMLRELRLNRVIGSRELEATLAKAPWPELRAVRLIILDPRAMARGANEEFGAPDMTALFTLPELRQIELGFGEWLDDLLAYRRDLSSLTDLTVHFANPSALHCLASRASELRGVTLVLHKSSIDRATAQRLHQAVRKLVLVETPILTSSD